MLAKVNTIFNMAAGIRISEFYGFCFFSSTSEKGVLKPSAFAFHPGQ